MIPYGAKNAAVNASLRQLRKLSSAEREEIAAIYCSLMPDSQLVHVRWRQRMNDVWVKVWNTTPNEGSRRLWQNRESLENRIRRMRCSNRDLNDYWEHAAMDMVLSNVIDGRTLGSNLRMPSLTVSFEPGHEDVSFLKDKDWFEFFAAQREIMGATLALKTIRQLIAET